MQPSVNSTLFIGKSLISLGSVDSTNNYLKSLVTNFKPLPEGAVILAADQFAGRGQAANKWLSEPGKNLTLSILLNPSFIAPARQFELNKAISLGVVDFTRSSIGGEVRIKWPNDIYHRGNKVGGILIENILAGMVLKHSIIGIGLNVNQEQFDDLHRASSFYLIKGSPFDLGSCLDSLCSYVEARYLQLKAGQKDLLDRDYLQSLYRLGELATYQSEEGVFEGTILGVDDLGRLLVQSRNQTRAYATKEISFL